MSQSGTGADSCLVVNSQLFHSARSGRETPPRRASRVLAGSDIRLHSRVLPALLPLKTKEKDSSQSIRHSLFPLSY